MEGVSVTKRRVFWFDLLRQGGTLWNTYRQNHPNEAPDLSHQNLENFDFIPDGSEPYNLARADLRGTNLPCEDRLLSGNRRVSLANAIINSTTTNVDNIDLTRLGAVFETTTGDGLSNVIRYPTVFLSYATTEFDSAIAEKLRNELKTHHFHVIIDKDDFVAGRQISDEIHRHLQTSDVFLGVFSRAYSDRKWTTFERWLALQRSQTKETLQGIAKPLLVVFVKTDDTAMPAEIDQLLHLAYQQGAETVICQKIRAAVAMQSLEANREISLELDLNSKEFHDCFSRVKSYMKELRSRMKSEKVDSSTAKGSEPWSDFYDNKAVKRLIIYLRSSGCRWAISVRKNSIELLPGCFDCEHSLAGSTFGKKIPARQYITQFERALQGHNLDLHPVLCVYNEGNFFNEEELPREARLAILNRIAQIDSVKSVIVESLPAYLTSKNLSEAKHILGSRNFEVGIGLESANPTIRKLCVNKSYSLEEFKKAVELVKCCNAQVLAYVLLKPAFLYEIEAIRDAVAAAQYAFETGVNYVSIEPVNISNFNMSGELNRISKYRSCWLWSVIEVVRQASEFGTVRLGGEQFQPQYTRHAFNCEKCNKVFYDAFQVYNSSHNIDVLLSLECECRGEWLKDLEVQRQPLLQRVNDWINQLKTSGGVQSKAD
jgi:radical SAM enzyme (TIGR01210 family)